jgi:hypothetical protein
MPSDAQPENTVREPEVRRLYGQAAAVVCNTEPAAEEMVARYPELAGKVVAIRNGSDLPVRPRRVPGAHEPFLIVHTGWLYMRRDPRPFLRALAAAVRELQVAPEALRVVFMGPTPVLEGIPLDEWATKFGVGTHVELMSPGPRSAVVALLEQAAMTVTFQGGEATRIPAKLYEYVSFPVWVMALASARGATARLLAGTDAAVHEIDDEDAIRETIVSAFRAFRRGELPAALDECGAFSRDTQSRNFESLLSRVTGGAG